MTTVLSTGRTGRAGARGGRPGHLHPRSRELESTTRSRTHPGARSVPPAPRWSGTL